MCSSDLLDFGLRNRGRRGGFGWHDVGLTGSGLLLKAFHFLLGESNCLPLRFKSFFQLFPGFIASLAGNGLVVGILFALLFEHILFKRKG